MNSLLSSFGEWVKTFADFCKTEQLLGLWGWIWVLIAAVVVVAVIVLIIVLVRSGKKKKKKLAAEQARAEEEAEAQAQAEQAEADRAAAEQAEAERAAAEQAEQADAENNGSEELMVSEEELEAAHAEIDRIFEESLQRLNEIDEHYRKQMEAIKRGETTDESDGGESAAVNGVTDDETIDAEVGQNENNDAAEEYSESGVVIAAEEQAEEEVPAEAPVYEEVAAAEEQTAPVEEQPAEAPAQAAAPEVKKPETKVYHISKRKADNRWQVKASKGVKAIKLFNTQAEAIEFAKKLAVNQEARIVIHKEDGTFRKITYKKK